MYYLNKIIVLLLINFSIFGNSKNAEKLAKSLLLYEKFDAPISLCEPYMNSENYPVIGYGKRCKTLKISNHSESKSYCENLSKKCTYKNVIQWLDEDIKKAIDCISNNEKYNKVYDSATDKRKAILISMFYQYECSNLNEIFGNIDELILNNNWKEVPKELLNTNKSLKNKSYFIRYSYVLLNDDCNIDFCNKYQWNLNFNDSDTVYTSSSNENSNNVTDQKCDIFHNLYNDINEIIQYNDTYENHELEQEQEQEKSGIKKFSCFGNSIFSTIILFIFILINF